MAQSDLAGQTAKARAVILWRNPWVRGDAADPFLALLVAVMFCAVVVIALLMLH